MAKHNCDACPFRARYDKKPTSISGRLWRWHINWCPGWKKYMNAMDDEKRAMITEKYNLR